MLADARHHDGVVGRGVAELLEHVLRLELVTVEGLLVVQRVALLPVADLRQPRGTVGLRRCTSQVAHRLHQLLDHEPAVAHDGHVGPAHLAQLGGIDVGVDDLGVGGERPDLAGDPVVEARAERDQQVGLLHRRDRGVVAVHPRHAEAERMAVGERTPRHQGRDDRDAGEVDQLAERFGGARLEDATARVDDRAAALGDQAGRLLDHLRVASRDGLVAREVDAVGPLPFHHLVGDVLGHVDEHGAGPAGGGDVERLAHGLWDVLRVGDEPVVLGDRHGDASGVALLEGVGADCGARHLAGDADHGDRVHVRVAQGRDDVGGRRATRHHGDAGPAGRVGVALGHVPRALLVAHEDVADRRVDDGVVHGQDGAAGQAEHHLHTFHLEALDQGLGAGELHERSLSSNVSGNETTSRLGGRGRTRERWVGVR